MAKMVQQTLVITVSKLVKGNDSSKTDAIFDADAAGSIEAVVAELIGDDSVLIEVEEIAAE